MIDRSFEDRMAGRVVELVKEGRGAEMTEWERKYGRLGSGRAWEVNPIVDSGRGAEMSYRVTGEAHGSSFDEKGFESRTEAEAYASSVIDGDVDSTIEVQAEDEYEAAMREQYGDEAWDGYVAYCEEQEARGPQAFLPETIVCYQCWTTTGHGIPRRVIREGRVVDRADPTQTYILECGHVGI